MTIPTKRPAGRPRASGKPYGSFALMFRRAMGARTAQEVAAILIRPNAPGDRNYDQMLKTKTRTVESWANDEKVPPAHARLGIIAAIENAVDENKNFKQTIKS